MSEGAGTSFRRRRQVSVAGSTTRAQQIKADDCSKFTLSVICSKPDLFVNAPE